MRVVAIDPGLTIGLAWYDTSSRDFEAWQTMDVVKAASWIRSASIGVLNVKYVVENYLSAGHLTKEAKETIKLVGFFEYWLGYELGDVTLAPPQKRLSGVTAAKKMAERDDIPGPHSWDALAHALVAARTV